MNICGIQYAPVWHDARASRQALDHWLERAASFRPDVVVLPEMFTTGFTMEPAAVAEPMDGPTMTWMRQWAQRLDAALVGSLVIRENGCFYNRMVWMNPDSTYFTYDKRHLFVLTQEPQLYCAGQQSVTVAFRNWRFRLAVCFDLRFPVWLFNWDYDYDVLIVVASWPQRRRYAWQQLLRARAIENQAYVVGINRVGDDPAEQYSGDSAIIDFRGEPIQRAAFQPALLHATLDKKALTDFRQRYPFVASAQPPAGP